MFCLMSNHYHLVLETPQANLSRFQLESEDEELRQAMASSRFAVGDESFREWVELLRRQVLERREVREDISFHRVVQPLGTGEVLRHVAGMMGVKESDSRKPHGHRLARAVAAKCMIRYSGSTQRQAAEELGLSTGASVCMQLKYLAECLAKDSALRSRLRRLEKKLAGLREERL
jgi:hypothetical protein